MSQQNDTGFITRTADEAIPLYAVVKLSSTGAGVCDLSAVPMGVAQEEAYAAGQEIRIKLLQGSQGTFKVNANEALAEGAVVYTEDGGLVQDTAATNSYPVGIALEAATAQNDVIEIAPYLGDGTIVS